MSIGAKQPPASNPTAKIIFLVFVALLIIAAGLHLFSRGGDASAPSADSRGGVDSGSAPAASESTIPQEPEAKPRPAFEKLVGRWLREDGGYVIELTAVLPDGTLQAGYFNPRPIHVSKAAAVEDGGSVKVGIELNDTGYPGCLYTLILNRELDQLQGEYFQAAQGQTYEVAFVRMPEE